MEDKQKKEGILLFICRTLQRDWFMVTIILVALVLCTYLAYYSAGYDQKIQEYYTDYIESNCRDMNGDLIFERPPLFSKESFTGEVQTYNLSEVNK